MESYSRLLFLLALKVVGNQKNLVLSFFVNECLTLASNPRPMTELHRSWTVFRHHWHTRRNREQLIAREVACNYPRMRKAWYCNTQCDILPVWKTNEQEKQDQNYAWRHQTSIGSGPSIFQSSKCSRKFCKTLVKDATLMPPFRCCKK